MRSRSWGVKNCQLSRMSRRRLGQIASIIGAVSIDIISAATALADGPSMACRAAASWAHETPQLQA